MQKDAGMGQIWGFWGSNLPQNESIPVVKA